MLSAHYGPGPVREGGSSVDHEQESLDDPETVERMSPVSHMWAREAMWARPVEGVPPPQTPLNKANRVPAWASSRFSSIRRAAAADARRSANPSVASPCACPPALLTGLVVLSTILSFLALAISATMQVRVSSASAEADNTLRSEGEQFRLEQSRSMVRMASLALPSAVPNEQLGLSWSPSGAWLITVSDLSLVTLWGNGQASPGEWPLAPVKTFNVHTLEVNSVEWQPGGLRAASVSADASLCVWGTGNDPSQWSPAPVAQFVAADGTPLNDVDWTPSGDVIAASSDGGSVYLFSGGDDPSTDPALWGSAPTSTWLAHVGPVESVSFMGPSAYLATGGADSVVKIWGNGSASWMAGAGGGALPQHSVFAGHAAPVAVVAWSPDGSWLASADSAGVILIWSGIPSSSTASSDWRNPLNWPSSPRVSLRGHTSGVEALSVSTSGHWLASGSDDRSIRMWRTPAGGTSAHAGGDAPDGTVSAVSGSGYAGGTWITASALTLSQAHGNSITGMGWSPAGGWLAASSDDGTVSLWQSRMP